MSLPFLRVPFLGWFQRGAKRKVTILGGVLVVGGLAPQINCFIHTPHPTFFSSSIFYPYSFSSFFYIPFCPSHPFFYHHFSKFCAILFSFLLASFISPTTLQNVISSISSPHPFQKKEILQNILQKIFVIKKIFELSKNDLSISRTRNRTATTSLPSFVSSLLSYIFLGRGRIACELR